MTAAPAWPSGYALEHFSSIDSTNEEARRRAAAGQSGPVWLVADIQTAGRGRRGRVWELPSGNLAASLLIRPGRPVGECALLSFVAALAASDAVARYAPGHDIKVKWPNDVLAGSAKIAGILLESASVQPDAAPWLAIGIGINLAVHPDGTEFPATSLGALGERVPLPREALTYLAAAFAKWYDLWCGTGFAPIREAWLARAAGLGKRIRARLHETEAIGVFEGMDEEGRLILNEGQGRSRAIAAGEVFFAS